MRLVRYVLDGRTGAGFLEAGPDGDVVRAPGTGRMLARLEEVRLLTPCEPRTIVCVGSNYGCQVAEKGRPHPVEPALFLKAPNAVIGPEEPILHPAEVHRLEYEGELAVVIGQTAREIPEDDALSYVQGLTCANDVTADDWRADGQWTRAKSADTFCPLGPWIETDLGDRGAGGRTLSTELGERTVQRSDTGRMIFSVPEILAHVTRWITLRPGDVVLTGSPAGVGPMVPGDRVTVEIDGLGRLANPVAARAGTGSQVLGDRVS